MLRGTYAHYYCVIAIKLNTKGHCTLYEDKLQKNILDLHPQVDNLSHFVQRKQS